jgi:hypothetical protein
MDKWFIIQSFYHGLIRSAREHIDAAVGGSFFAHNIEEAQALIQKMASSQSWTDECTQSHICKVYQFEEVDMITTKIDLLMKKLEDPGLNDLKMVISRMTCEECGDTSHMGINCPMVCQDVNFIGNSNGFHSNQSFNSGCNKPRFPFDNRPRGGNE